MPSDEVSDEVSGRGAAGVRQGRSTITVDLVGCWLVRRAPPLTSPHHHQN